MLNSSYAQKSQRVTIQGTQKTKPEDENSEHLSVLCLFKLEFLLPFKDNLTRLDCCLTCE